MFNRRRRRGVPPLNTTSTADISFMLLIFFLVTTSMGADKGVKRELPPVNPKEQPATAVSQGEVMHVEIKAGGQIVCDGKQMEHSGFRKAMKGFIKGNEATRVVQLQSDRDATYDTYYFVLSELQQAYRELRDERAQREYGRAYDQLTDAQKSSIDKAIPQRIAEDYGNAAPTGKEAAR